MQTQQQTIHFNGHRIEFIDKTENGRTKYIARCYKPTPRATYLKEKIIFGYYFFSDAEREKYVCDWQHRQKELLTEQQQRKDAKTNARKTLVNPFVVGEILYSSWGYDQTNIDFYQVVEVGQKTVKIRSIGGQMVEGTAGHDCQNVRPIADKFYGEVETKVIQCYLNSDNTPHYYIKAGGHSLHKYDGGEKGVYSSWGH